MESKRDLIKKYVAKRIDKLGDNYSTFFFANKVVVHHEVEKDLSCHIIVSEDCFCLSIRVWDKSIGLYRNLLQVSDIPYDRLDYFLTQFVDVCSDGSKIARNIYNYIDSLPNLKVGDIEESTVSESFNEHFSKYGLAQFGRVLIGRYIGTICIRDDSNLTVSVLDDGEMVIFCKPVNQINCVELFKEVDELLVDVMKNLPSDLDYFNMLKRRGEQILR